MNRSNWGLAWNTVVETGGFVVGDEITISCEIELLNLGEKDDKMELENSRKKNYHFKQLIYEMNYFD
ncbi:MAG: hypothetical protein ACK504_01410 [Bacteroidota bacterium]